MMDINSIWTKLWTGIKKYAVLIFPAIFLVLTILIHISLGKFYMVGTDPEYFHLFNGLNLSMFNLAIDYIDHPGTTVQVIYAISAHIVNLIQPANDLITNALDHPEEFIHGASILLSMVTSLTLVLLGFYTYKYTGNLLLALLLQLLPFGSMRILLISGRLLPETALIGPLIILILLIIKFIYDDHTNKNSNIYLFGFAIVGGLGMAGKILYLPFLIIPLFLLSSVKTRLKYLLFTFIAFVFFAFPVFVNIGKSFKWFGNMFLHSGNWGSGETNIMDIGAIPERLDKIYHMDQALFIIMGCAVVLIIVFYSFSLHRKNDKSAFLLRTMIAVLVSLLLSVILITKHFAFHYFVPGLVFKVFIIFLMTSLFINLTNARRIQFYISAAAFLITIALVNPQINSLKDAVQQNRERAIHLDDRAYILKDYNISNNTLIISSNYSGSPFVQSALVDGFLISGHLKSTFIKHLTIKYPNTYFYVGWSEQFYLWDQFKDAKEFVKPQRPIYIYIGEGKEANLEIILDRIKTDLPAYQVKLNLLHHFIAPESYFYELILTDMKDGQKI